MKTPDLKHVAICVILFGGCNSFTLSAQEKPEDDIPIETDAARTESPTGDEDFLAQDIDPDSPLAPMPGMDVDWPDFEELPALPEMVATQEATELDTDPLASDLPSENIETAKVEQFQDRQDASEISLASGLAEGDFEYIVDIKYLDTKDFIDGRKEEFEDRFGELSKLRGLEEDEANVAQISRRAREDSALLEQLLRNYGYYDFDIFQLIGRSGDAGALRVEFGLQLGPVYRYDDIVLDGLDTAGSDAPLFRQQFGLESGAAINSDEILAARSRLDQGLAESGYAFATLGEPDLTIDHADRTGNLTIPVDPQRKYRFGQIRVGENPVMSARHLQRIARFDPGDLYQRSRLEDLRRAILATGLVSSLTLTTVADGNGPVAAADSALPSVDIEVQTVTAPLRTIAGELGYGSGEGVRIEASWEHRNFFAPEGLVRVRGVAGTQEQLLSFLYRRNNFKKRDQVLTAQLLASNITRNAFDARTLLLRAGIERQTNLIFQKKWTWSLGAELIATDERDITASNMGIGRRTFFIGALPGTLNYDGSDDLLDPRTGFRLGGSLSPELSLQDGTFGYARAQIDGSYYQPVSQNVVLAGRVRFATILGANVLQIAPSRRLYAGGGASVRGYGYNSIGPRDINNDPIGGRSLAEFSLEARVRFGNFGVVPFIDAGNVYSDRFPEDISLRFGVGIGVRYYSNFGPIRIDVATPLDRQPGDSRIGVYISLGQAF